MGDVRLKLSCHQTASLYTDTVCPHLQYARLILKDQHCCQHPEHEMISLRRKEKSNLLYRLLHTENQQIKKGIIHQNK